jgi:hypothetical protein
MSDAQITCSDQFIVPGREKGTQKRQKGFATYYHTSIGIDHVKHHSEDDLPFRTFGNCAR